MADDDKKKQEGDASLEARPADQAPDPSQIGATVAPEPDLGQPALPQSVLGTEVPPGQPIPPQKMGEAEHLAVNPHAEEEFRGKQNYHNQLREFGEQRKALNTAQIAGLDVKDPHYLQNLAVHLADKGRILADEGTLRREEAEYKQQPEHQWGHIESAHPGTFGKIGHAFGTIGNIAGNALIPNVMPSIPGSWANLAAQARGGAGEEKAGGKEAQEAIATGATAAEIPEREAKTEHEKAETKALGEAPPKAKTLQQAYADAVQDVVKHGGDPLTDPLVMHLQDGLTALQKQPAAPSEQAKTLQLPSGQKAPGKVDHQGNLLLADGTPAPSGTMLYQQPNYGQLVLPTKTIQVLNDQGIPTTMGFNPKTHDYDIPQGQSATGAYAHEEAQAGAVNRAGNDLIAAIQANKGDLGTLKTWVKNYGLNTPIADPTLAYLQAKISTFAALQPALHGFKSRNALGVFEKVIGGLQKDPNAMIESIRGILGTAGAINPNLSKGGAGAAPPTGAGGGFASWKAGQGAH